MNMKLLKSMIIVMLLITTGCLPKPDYYDEQYYTDYTDYTDHTNSTYTEDTDNPDYPDLDFPDYTGRDTENTVNRMRSALDFIKAVNDINNFVIDTDIYILSVFRFLTIYKVECDQYKDQLSESLNLISQQLNELEEEISNLLEVDYSSGFLNDVQERKGSIEETKEQLTDNVDQCIQQYKDQLNSAQA